MIYRFLFSLLALLLLAEPLFAVSDITIVTNPHTLQNSSVSRPIDRLLESAIQRGLIAGGVVLVGSRDRTVFEAAYGRISPQPDAAKVTPDTIFDLASLTKVLATTPAILKLAEEGRISLVDPVKKWLPEFTGHGKDDLLILHLLTHTSGLDDVIISHEKPLQSAIEGAAGESLKGEAGVRFAYADINFILLAEIVKRVSGESLADFSTKRFYRPLAMVDTGFNPPKEKLPRIAATVGESGELYFGEPQDFQARRLGGVAGNAGLFSTARDIGIFCRTVLSGGAVDNTRVMAERTVNQMTAPYYSRGGRVARGLGWDIASPYSSPRGGFFSESSFGHTGYSGTSVWIDPEADIFVILLTVRLEYKKKHEFNLLRSELSTIVAESFGKPVSLKELEELAQ